MLEKILRNLKDDVEYVCYSDGENRYSNKDMYRFVSNIYTYLLRVNPEKSPVVVIGHKDVFVIASFLACSFAGMAYVPLDESLPSGRVENILKQISPKVIIDKRIGSVMTEGDNNSIDRIYMSDNEKEFTPEEVDNILDIKLENAFNYRTKAMLELMYGSGLRVSELVNLTLYSIDLYNNTILIEGKGRKERKCSPVSIPYRKPGRGYETTDR